VIDGTVAFTGSQNIVEASYGHKRAGVWHDIMARITGPVVRQLQSIFLEDWFYASGELLEDPGLYPVGHPAGSIAIQVIPTGPDQPTELFQDLVVRSIFLARHRIVITSPYFIPNEAMLLALRLAALRGVQVDIAIPKQCDHRITNAAGAFYCDYLMRFGVRVFLFQEGMLHAKTLTIDNELGMFGSANYDISFVQPELRVEPIRPRRLGGRGDAPFARRLLGQIAASRARPMAVARAGQSIEAQHRQALQPADVEPLPPRFDDAELHAFDRRAAVVEGQAAIVVVRHAAMRVAEIDVAHAVARTLADALQVSQNAANHDPLSCRPDAAPICAAASSPPRRRARS